MAKFMKEVMEIPLAARFRKLGKTETEEYR
jgi:hypothetical protein